MKRTGFVVLGVALTALTAALLYTALAREAEYRRLIAEGEAALASDQTFAAVEAFSGAIALKPDSMLAHLRRGEAYRRRGSADLPTALRDLRMAAQLDRTALKPQEELGDVNFALERFERAVESYRGYLNLDDRSAAVWYKLALTQFRLGNLSAAIPALRQAVVLDDQFAEAFYLLGVCQTEAGKPDEAAASFDRAIQLAPRLSPPRDDLVVRARQQLVRVLLQLKREPDAIGELEKLAAFEPTKPGYLIDAAVIYARMGRPESAVTELNRAAERDPSEPRVNEVAGRMWLEAAESRHDRNALNKALNALSSAVRGPTATSQGFTLYGRALVLAGDLAGAQQAFDQALQKTPVDPVAYRETAFVAQRRGDVALARDALVRYLAIATDPAEIAATRERLADLSLRLNQPADAAKWLRQASAACDDEPATIERLATLQLRAGDSAGAAITIDKGLRKSPASASLIALRRRVQQ